MQNYHDEIKAASNYLDLPLYAASRVRLQSIDKGFVGGNLVRYHYNLYSENGRHLGVIEIFPDFEDQLLASQKVLSALKARTMNQEQIKANLQRQRAKAIAHNNWSESAAISVDELIDIQAEDWEYLEDICTELGDGFFSSIRWKRSDDIWKSPEKRKQWGYE